MLTHKACQSEIFEESGGRDRLEPVTLCGKH